MFVAKITTDVTYENINKEEKNSDCCVGIPSVVEKADDGKLALAR